MNKSRQLVAIMFTDIKGYTHLMQQDENAALNAISNYRTVLESKTKSYNGEIVQFYGDGSLSIYPSVYDAVQCAIEMQKEYRRGQEKLPVRVGIHFGDVVRKDNTIYGDAVNLAARIESQGQAGSILISEKVKKELANHNDIQTIDKGKVPLKNVNEAIRLFAIKDDALIDPTITTDKAHRGKTFKGLYMLWGILLMIAIWLVLDNFLQNNKQNAFIEERIAVPEFTDLTLKDEYSDISKMASHWITNELIETNNAKVIRYESAVTQNKMQLASLSGQKTYARKTGAVNAIMGDYYLIGKKKDSLEFRIKILNLATNEYLPIKLRSAKCPGADPLVCLKEIGSMIKGYWSSKSDKMLTIPNYEAYKLYLEARQGWTSGIEDIDAERLIRGAISADPNFFDAYLLLLDLLYNSKRHSESYDTLKTMRNRFTDRTERQENYMRYHESDIAGQNVGAFNLYQYEYKIDPKDVLTNTTNMVLATNYVNAPKKAIDFFWEIDPGTLDLASCEYCGFRYAKAIEACWKSGQIEVANSLAEDLIPHTVNRYHFKALVEFYISQGDTATVNNLLEESEEIVKDRDFRYLYFVAGRQSELNGFKDLRDHYGQLGIQIYGNEPSRMLARCHKLIGNYEKALSIYKKALANKPGEDHIIAEMGIIYAQLNDDINAEKMISELESRKSDFDYGNIPYYQARIYASLNRPQIAINLLKRAVQEGKQFVSSVSFNDDPDLKPLFEHPEYQALLKRI